MPDGYNAAPPTLASEVLAGLGQAQKTLPAKLFYDVEGCRLFGKITRLPEYYLTRTEQALLDQVAVALPRMPGSALVEYGASDEAKALRLLDRIGAGTYVPIDIAGEALLDLTARLADTRPDLLVRPITADFLQPLELPQDRGTGPCLGFFPGSTIGNLDRATALRFLTQVRQTLGDGAKFLVGADLRKAPAILLPAYDDSQGVTAAFNLNILAHINRELGSDFDLAQFAHRAVWNEAEGRIEMHLVSRSAQSVLVAGVRVSFKAGETIHTESSHKHTIQQFIDIAHSAGWQSEAVWTDAENLFSIHLLANRADRH